LRTSCSPAEAKSAKTETAAKAPSVALKATPKAAPKVVPPPKAKAQAKEEPEDLEAAPEAAPEATPEETPEASETPEAPVTLAMPKAPVMAPIVSTSSKQELMTYCGKIARKVMAKGDVLYECTAVQGGFQATVTLLCLEGEWAGASFAGEIGKDKATAEHSVAGIALEAIKADEELMQKFKAPKPAKKNPAAKAAHASWASKGKGKGVKGKAWW